MAAGPPSSSPGDLSTPPKSPSPGEAIILNHKPSNGVSTGAVCYPDLSGAAPSANGTAGGARKEDIPEKAPRKRRARASTVDPKDEEDSSKPAKAPRKSRAPRKPKTESDAANPPTKPVPSAGPPPAPPLATSTTSANMQPGRPPSRQQKITDLVNHDTPVSYGTYSNTGSPSAHNTPYYNGSGDSQRPQFKTEQTAHPHVTTNSSGNSPRSGQRYDPIRSSTVMENQRPYPTSTTPHQTSPIKSTYRASASPSISSLIDPPTTSNPSYSYSTSAKPSPVPAHAVPQATSQSSSLSNQPSPVQNPQKPAQPIGSATQSKQQLEVADAMDVDSTSGKAVSRKTSISNTNPPSKAASPKPPKKDKDKVGTTPPLPPLPGSSIIASTLFGPNQGPVDTGAGTSIILHISLNGETNKYVNFARLAEEKYGFAALHPRLAAQKERLAKVAAAGAALENVGKGSGDEMSLDISDAENELSNADTGAEKADAATDANGKKPRKKRRMKEDMYDKDDPFVDDTELAWEEMAAASKDGFFVYSGPLIPDGETARVERADGTIIKPPSGRGRGRGRGGGPGSRGGTSRTGGGPGSRGGQGGARRNRGNRKGAAAATNGEARSKTGTAGDGGESAANTPSKTTTAAAPTHSSPLGQTVQVQVPAASAPIGGTAKHDSATPTVAAA